MRSTFVFFVLFLVMSYGLTQHIDDNDFAEFEDFDDDFVVQDSEVLEKGAKSIQNQNNARDTESPSVSKSVNKKGGEFDDPTADDDDGLVEDEEFEHFHDEEEFEGFDNDDSKEIPLDQKIGLDGEPKLTISKVPIHFRTHWDSYWMEMLMIAGLTTYFANFFLGKNKNSKLAHLWLNTHRQLLEENFVLVGDSGRLENENPGLNKESESLYTLWCSGRTCCEGMLVELKMIKRQDLVSLVSGILRPQQDQVHIKIELSKDVMDTFIFCIASKKSGTKMFKELNDLSKFCTLVSKPEEKYRMPNGFVVLSEIPEATVSLLSDTRFSGALSKFTNYIDYIHISDQFSGPIQQEDPNVLKQPETKRMLLAGFNLPNVSSNNCDMESIKPLLMLIFYLLERLKRFRLSKESKTKAEKNRQRVEEEFLKSTHAARVEAARERREDKRKQEKERVMAEDDPEKQRRWELKEQKRQAKKKAPKMKRLAVKSI
ncbi:PAT complex subunit CCDC47 [Condylostylus longicornis]|uniref:PAT complex subunit CCDC47 n=1 Tax=Condylostylus longicornis TaxID=2530218 RepID=UPI00244E384E|nr:PAT complex subunit CCDC47 [Condylostylus longicornis]